jgi:hypothetical protein
MLFLPWLLPRAHALSRIHQRSTMHLAGTSLLMHLGPMEQLGTY